MRTKKPCPGCGEVDIWRKADEVCRECKIKISRFDELEKETKKKSEVFVYFGERYHWNKYIHTRGGLESSDLMKAFHRLALAASKFSLNPPHIKDGILILDKVEGVGIGRIMDKETAEAFLALHKMIQPLIDSVYESGKRDGHNLLMRLASGDLAPNEYMQETEAVEEE